MPDAKFSNTGALFHARKTTNPKAPVYSGNVEIGQDLLRYLVDEIKAGREAKLQLAGWKRQSKKGEEYLSLQLSKPFAKQPDIADAAMQAYAAKQRKDDLDDSEEIPF